MLQILLQQMLVALLKSLGTLAAFVVHLSYVLNNC